MCIIKNELKKILLQKLSLLIIWSDDQKYMRSYSYNTNAKISALNDKGNGSCQKHNDVQSHWHLLEIYTCVLFIPSLCRAFVLGLSTPPILIISQDFPFTD